MKNDQRELIPPSSLQLVTLKYALGAFLFFVVISLWMGGLSIFLYGVVAGQVLVGSVLLMYAIGSLTAIGKPTDQLVLFWFIPCITIIFIISGINTLMPLPGGWVISLFSFVGMSTFLWLPFVSQRYWRWLYTTFVEGARKPKSVTISSKTLKIAMAAGIIGSAIGQNMDDWFGAEAQAYLLAGVVWLFGYGTFFLITVTLLAYTSFYSGVINRD